MSEHDAYEYEDKGLRDLIRTLTASIPNGRIGILGGKNIRGEKPKENKAHALLRAAAGIEMKAPDAGRETNAQIGAKHEFGDAKLPMRSFLRIPIIDNMQKYLDESNAFGPKVAKDVLAKKSFVPWLTKIMILAESIVADAFETGGFGKWKPSNMKYKKNHQTLVETQQLRNSITSEVKE